MQVKVSAQYKNEIDMAKAQRDYELKKAAYDIEVNTKKAESEMAYQLQVHTLKKKKSLVHVTVQPLGVSSANKNQKWVNSRFLMFHVSFLSE